MFFISKLRTAAAVLKSKPVVQTAVRHGGTWYYRRPAADPPKRIMYHAEFMGFLMWYWILYHLWKEPEHITGHFPYPDPAEWTDEELGIPPEEED
ncbi:NADH dehydrogenase [ubiquinone] 1 beta subcomplex subunit 2, mitochondrial-like [Babylonia areolata]|uniref:NADH dehydrogenase [ubiquinone] 1 beta subcomplex subunit 2, mitochondrial-like n=1 Tax=Babylonia areolata TaxID=304850 RepID=UPI003FD315E6